MFECNSIEHQNGGGGVYKVNKYSKSNKLRCNDMTNFNDFD